MKEAGVRIVADVSNFVSGLRKAKDEFSGLENKAKSSGLRKSMDDTFSGVSRKARKELSGIAKEMDAVAGKLDGMRARYNELDKLPYSSGRNAEKNNLYPQIEQLTAQADVLAAKYARVEDSARRVGNASGLTNAANEAGRLGKEATKASFGLRKIGDASKDAAKKSINPLKSITKAVGQAIRRFLMLSLAYKGVRAAAQYLTGALKTNKQFTDSLNAVKVNLATAFQPIYNAVLPAINALMSFLSKATGVIASFVSALFGTTYSASKDAAASLDSAKNAMEGYGGAVKDTERQLAGFDKFNDITPQKSGGGGGGGSSSEGMDFSAVKEPVWLENFLPNLKDILWYASAIGAGLLGWKIASSFGASLKTCLGVFMAIAGSVVYVKGLTDAWSNGTSWKSLTDMVLGLGLAAGGLAIAFGPAVAGVALITGGIGMLAVAIKDLLTGKASLSTLVTAVIGATAVFGGLVLVTGSLGGAMAILTSPITLTIAAIAALIAIVVLLVKNWDWVKETAAKCLEGIQAAWKNVSAWFDTKVVQPIKNFFGGLWNGIKAGAGTLFSFIKERVIDPIVSAFKWMYNSVVGIIEGIINGFVGIINGFINGINGVIKTINKIPGVNLGTIRTLNRVSIPRMAQGGLAYGEVNAIVGDNFNARQNPEVIAPLSDLRGMITEAMLQRDMAGGGGEITLKMIMENGEIFAEAMIDPLNRTAKNKGYGPVFRVVPT